MKSEPALFTNATLMHVAVPYVTNRPGEEATVKTRCSGPIIRDEDLRHLLITRAAAAFGAILYTVVTGDSIVSALSNIISRALNTNV